VFSDCSLSTDQELSSGSISVQRGAGSLVFIKSLAAAALLKCCPHLLQIFDPSTAFHFSSLASHSIYSIYFQQLSNSTSCGNMISSENACRVLLNIFESNGSFELRFHFRFHYFFFICIFFCFLTYPFRYNVKLFMHALTQNTPPYVISLLQKINHRRNKIHIRTKQYYFRGNKARQANNKIAHLDTPEIICDRN
jgi:hypothetical protein